MEGGYVVDKRELYHAHAFAQPHGTRADWNTHSPYVRKTEGPGIERNAPVHLPTSGPLCMSVRHLARLGSLLAFTAVAVALAAAASCSPTGNMASSEEDPPGAAGGDTLLTSTLREEDPTGLNSFRQLLDRDDIAPIYDPSFVPVSQSGLQPDEMVIGVSIDGDSRAYPIRYLRWREMVNDEVGGIPILVTW